MMHSIWISVTIAFGLYRIKAVQGVNLNGTEKLLFRDLLAEYDLVSRPVYNASTKVSVEFELSLNQIYDLDEKNQILSTSVWIFEEWFDENLRWSPEDYHGLDTLMIPSGYLWVPDIFIYNTAGGELDGFVNVSESKVKISSNGKVNWAIPLLLKSSCWVDVTYFPYDEQKCIVRFGSWIYDGKQLDLYTLRSEPDMTQYIRNPEFDFLNATLERVEENSTCCPGEGSHPMIHLAIHIKRKSLYYDYIVIAPTIMLCVLTLATFLLPCDCGGKIAIGLTVFLVLYVLQLLIADNVPDTNQTPILSLFLFMVMTLNSVSLIMATVVMNIRKRALQKPIPKVPDWIMWVCEYILAYLVCVKLTDWKHPMNLCDSEDDSDEDSDFSSEAESSSIDNAIVHKFENCNYSDDTSDDFPQSPVAPRYNSTEDSYARKARIEEALAKYQKVEEVPVRRSRRTKKPRTSYRELRRMRCSYRKAVRQTGDALLPRMPDEDENQSSKEAHKGVIKRTNVKYEWCFVAEVVDKFSFVIYWLTLTATVLSLLVIVPSMRHQDKD